jgi:protein phosphatase
VKVPAHLQVGACSHTGLVRGGNEDDYLLAGGGPGGTFLCAVADGMGGLAGGAEASRTALRALGQCVLDEHAAPALAQRLHEGFAAASLRVHEASAAVPSLREMGTTLTALCFQGGEVALGHVGDSRAYRLRAGRCDPISTDHAVRQPENLLTRCIGAGQETVEADVTTFALGPGERFLLVSDGVWSVLPAGVLAKLGERGPPQQAAEALVAEALAAGGPDNATAVVVAVVGQPAAGLADVDLPRDERPDDRRDWPRPRSLRGPAWPWLLLAVALAAGVHAALRWGGISRGLFGFGG